MRNRAQNGNFMNYIFVVNANKPKNLNWVKNPVENFFKQRTEEINVLEFLPV